MSKKKITIYNICSIGIFSAVISIMAQISIPMPSGVPITLQSFAIILTAIVLPSPEGLTAVLVYLLLGAVGLPVFAHFRGGLQAILSPAGGFLLSFPFMAYLVGLGAKNKHKHRRYPISLMLALAVNFIFGTLVYCLYTNSTLPAALLTCVLPLLPSTILTAVLASVLGFKVKHHISRIFS